MERIIMGVVSCIMIMFVSLFGFIFISAIWTHDENIKSAIQLEESGYELVLDGDYVMVEDKEEILNYSLRFNVTVDHSGKKCVFERCQDSSHSVVPLFIFR